MWLFVLSTAIVGGILLYLIQFIFFPSKKVKKYPSFVRKADGYVPVLGNAADFGPDTCCVSFEKYPIKYGKFVEFYLSFIYRSILITDINISKEILAKRPKTFQRLQLILYAAKVLNLDNALFNAEGSIWLQARKVIAPSFSLLNISSKLPMILEEMNSWISRLKERCTDEMKKKNQDTETDNSTSSSKDGVLFNMRYETFTLTIRVISIIAFGLSTTNPISSYFFSSQFPSDVNDMFTFMAVAAGFPLPRFFWKLFPSKLATELKAIEVDKRFTQKCEEIIEYKRQLIREGNQTTTSMLDTLLINEATSSDKALSDELLISNVKIFYLTGTDTTSVTITWALYYFCLFPEILQKTREEANKILFQGKSSFIPESNNFSGGDYYKNLVNSLKYSMSVVKETLRLKGPSPVTIFEMAEGEAKEKGVTLSNGIELSPGDLVWVNQDGIHQDPEVFIDPFTFNPDRWLSSDTKRLELMEEHFIPFGHGPRVCPGINVALYEACLAICFLAYHFDMKLGCPPEEIIRIANFVVTPNKMPVYLIPVGK
jgi:cytochrome P450